MSDFWIRDDAGRVLGPIGLAVLRDLIAAGRLSRILAASRDGRTFEPVAGVPEVADLVLREARNQDDRAEAERIGTLLHEMRSRPQHEVFELSPNATLDDFKSAFFRLAKQYHPDRLHADALPELRLAYDSLFHFLATTMAAVETRLASAAPPPVARPGSGAAHPGTARASAPPRSYAPEAFVGLVQRPDGQPEVEVHVTPSTVGIFTENELVNLAKDGVFLPVTQGVPLGTALEVRFVFDDPKRVVAARGRVVFENFGGRARGKPGVGVKFVRLADGDRVFLIEYVKRAQDAAKPATQPRR